MEKGRVEAFTDGVIAIIITIMVLELKTPHAPTWDALHELWPVFGAYVLSFIYVGIYWNNHHHMFKAVEVVSGPVLWSNLHLLFWLSLFPFTTAWMSETGFSTLPTALYGITLLMAAVAWPIRQAQLIRCNGRDGTLARAVGTNVKGWISIVGYVLGIAAAFIHPLLGCALYAAVALVWFIPDKRIERVQAT
ncbi:MAG: TMEM175 family protein [Dokdonella sp.]|uniref:TMEM175 family protein n=1 Tax=Dokdonella sp. TaxID=2291710 RepID=UPI003265BDDC